MNIKSILNSYLNKVKTMPKEDTIELRHVRGVIGEKTDLPRVNPGASLSGKIGSMLLKQSGVPELAYLFGSSNQNKDITLEAGESDIVSMASDGTSLYVGTNTTPGIIVKIDIDTFTRVGAITLNANENNIYSLWLDSTYLYAGAYNTVGAPVFSRIVRIRLSDFTRVDALILTEHFLNELTSDGTFLYGATLDNVVAKVNIDSFTEVDTLATSGSDLICDGPFLYVAAGAVPETIRKIDLSTFTVLSTITFAAGEDTAGKLFKHGKYLYVGLNISPGKVIKVDLDTFTEASTVTFNAGENLVSSLFSDGPFLYAGMRTSPGQLVMINLGVFARESAFAFDAGYNTINCMWTDSTYVYIGFGTNPGRIARRYILPSVDLYQRKIDLIDEQTHSGKYYITPAAAAGILLTSSAVAWTKGSYSEIVASSGYSTIWLTGIVLNSMPISVEMEVDIATGAAGSESVIATVAHIQDSGSRAMEYTLSPPIKVAAGTRLSGRVAKATAAAGTLRVKLRYKD